MRILNKLPAVMLLFSASLAEPALAQLDIVFAEGERQAAVGDIPGAVATCQTLAESQPNSKEVHACLGGMQLLGQRYTNAIDSFQRAVTLGEKSSRPFIGMGIAYLHLGRMQAARASFVEAENRGTEHPDELDRLIAWIDDRAPTTQARSHP